MTDQERVKKSFTRHLTKQKRSTFGTQDKRTGQSEDDKSSKVLASGVKRMGKLKIEELGRKGKNLKRVWRNLNKS